jgi:hypothetical protein
MKQMILTALAAIASFILEPIKRYAEANLVLYAYRGSATEATTDRNAPIQICGVLSPGINTFGSVLSPTTAQSTANYVGGASLWYYRSSDSATIASSPGYFTNGGLLGMKTGDVMLYVSQSSYGTSPAFGIGVLTTTAGTSAGGAYTGAFNLAQGAVIQNS